MEEVREKIRKTFCKKELEDICRELREEVLYKQKALGTRRVASTYQPKKPCKRCSHSLRYLSNRACVECSKKQAKDWNRTNPEAVKRTGERWEANNRDRRKEVQRNYQETAREELNAISAIWEKVNPEKASAKRQNRRARVRGAEGTHTHLDVMAIKERQNSRCVGCLVDVDETGFHLDHIQPLSKGGSNYPENLQILCPKCNLSKGAKDPEEWLKEIEALR